MRGLYMWIFSTVIWKGNGRSHFHAISLFLADFDDIFDDEKLD